MLFGETAIDGRIILKYVIKEERVSVWVGFSSGYDLLPSFYDYFRS
jgi:hypothetical protein